MTFKLRIFIEQVKRFKALRYVNIVLISTAVTKNKDLHITLTLITLGAVGILQFLYLQEKNNVQCEGLHFSHKCCLYSTNIDHLVFKLPPPAARHTQFCRQVPAAYST